MGSYRGFLAAIPLLFLLAAGCGTTPTPGSAASPSPRPRPTLSNDPEVLRAAQVLHPILEDERFADSFAGIVNEHQAHRLVIYRLPDPGLDAAVREANPGATVVLRPAKYSLREMKRIRDRVMNDAAYWQKRGIEIRSGAPSPTGAGAVIGTAEGTSAERAMLVEHYGTGAIIVKKAGKFVFAR